MSEVVDHPIMGRLTWDDSQPVWTGDVELRAGLRVIVTVEARGEKVDAALAAATRGMAWLRGHKEKARLLVADAYLDTFNRN